MKPHWRYLLSFLREEVVEVGHSEIAPGLQVWYAYGRRMLNISRRLGQRRRTIDLHRNPEALQTVRTGPFLRRLAHLLCRGGCLLFNRLARTERLREQAEAFGRKMSEALPGSQKLNADLNQVWVYEKLA